MPALTLAAAERKAKIDRSASYLSLLVVGHAAYGQNKTEDQSISNHRCPALHAWSSSTMATDIEYLQSRQVPTGDAVLMKVPFGMPGVAGDLV